MIFYPFDLKKKQPETVCFELFLLWITLDITIHFLAFQLVYSVEIKVEGQLPYQEYPALLSISISANVAFLIPSLPQKKGRPVFKS